MRRTVSILVLVAALVAAAAPAAALPGDPPPPPLQGLAVGDPPAVTARAWLLYDDTFEFELAGSSEDVELPMASTTKMMTALVAIEQSDPDELVVVSEHAAAVGEAEVGLQPGEVFTIDELVTVMLVRSANDAAVAVAEHVAGSEAAFVDLMNRRADELGLEHTKFANPHGLDAPGHYSSARDLLVIALAGMDHPEFAAAVRMTEHALQDAPDGTGRTAETTNRLLEEGFEGIIGVKTGFTADAGLTFVAASERGDRRLYAVVLGSTGVGGHFTDAAALLDWGFAEFLLVQVFVEGTTYGQYRGTAGVEPLVAEESSRVLLTRSGRNGDVTLEPRFDLETPVMVATLDDTELTSVPLSVTSDRSMPSFADAFGWIGKYWDWLWSG